MDGFPAGRMIGMGALGGIIAGFLLASDGMGFLSASMVGMVVYVVVVTEEKVRIMQRELRDRKQ
jgi:hypothetical protein